MECLEIVKIIIKAIVENPDEVVINQTDLRGIVLITIGAEQNDRGRIIGKEGKTIAALEKLMRVIYAKAKKKVLVKVID